MPENTATGGSPGTSADPSMAQDVEEPLLQSVSSADAEVQQHPRLLPVLSWIDGVAVSVGVVVGSGIFASPGQMMQHVGSTGLSLVTWALAGLVALCSSLVYAELAPMIPTAGGDRDYISAAFGRTVSHAYSLTMFVVIKPGCLGILAITFARYCAALIYPDAIIHDSDLIVKVLGVSSMVAVTLLNCTGVRETSTVQNILTSTKVLMLGLVVAAALVSLSSSEGREIAAENLGRGAFEGSKPAGMGPALIGALWAFDGWNDIVFMAEELKEPSKLPRIIMVSLSVCALLYLAISVCYDAVLPAEVILRSTTVALDTVKGTLGEWAFVLTGVLVSISVLGSLNASTMTGGRLFFAGAREGEFPRCMAVLGQHTHAPYTALLGQMLVVCVLLLLPGSSFNNLVAYFGSASWLWYGATGLSLVTLRYTQPDLHRPYRCPLPCAFLIVGVAAYLILDSALDPSTRVQTLTSIGFAATAVVGCYVYYTFADTKYRRARSA